MTKLKGLILTEGMHGMISQAEGLAKVLDLEVLVFRLAQHVMVSFLKIKK